MFVVGFNLITIFFSNGYYIWKYIILIYFQEITSNNATHLNLILRNFKIIFFSNVDKRTWFNIDKPQEKHENFSQCLGDFICVRFYLFTYLETDLMKDEPLLWHHCKCHNCSFFILIINKPFFERSHFVGRRSRDGLSREISLNWDSIFYIPWIFQTTVSNLKIFDRYIVYVEIRYYIWKYIVQTQHEWL